MNRFLAIFLVLSTLVTLTLTWLLLPRENGILREKEWRFLVRRGAKASQVAYAPKDKRLAEDKAWRFTMRSLDDSARDVTFAAPLHGRIPAGQPLHLRFFARTLTDASVVVTLVDARGKIQFQRFEPLDKDWRNANIRAVPRGDCTGGTLTFLLGGETGVVDLARIRLAPDIPK
jgi:hypothetical protein